MKRLIDNLYHFSQTLLGDLLILWVMFALLVWGIYRLYVSGIWLGWF